MTLRTCRWWRRLYTLLPNVAAATIAAYLLAAAPASLAAQPTSPESRIAFRDSALTALTLALENDVFWQLGDNFDRNYTGGLVAILSGDFVRRWELDKPLRGIDHVTGSQRRHDRWSRSYTSLTLVGTGFTPDSLNTTEILQNDRPYASIIGLAVRRVGVNDETLAETWSSELTIGALGWNLARNAQTWIHRQLRGPGETTPYDPLGWHNQISAGGELAVLYRVGYERVVAGNPNHDERKHFQMSAGWQLSAGYYTQSTGLLNARLGYFDSQFWEFTPSASAVANQNVGRVDRADQKWELFVFGGLRPRVNIYNSLLQGQLRESAHTFAPSDIERLQAEWDLGIAWRVPSWRSTFIWNAYPGRTAEFKGPEARTHTWGSLMYVHTLPAPKGLVP